MTTSPIVVRDRVRELRRVRAGDLAPHPRNWRTHPPRQRAALAALLTEIGYADALLARELPGGALQLIDGHLRAETTPDAQVPVLVVDVDEAEADALLATLDPLAAMAGSDAQKIAGLLQGIQVAQQTVVDVLGDLQRKTSAVVNAQTGPAIDSTNRSAPADAEPGDEATDADRSSSDAAADAGDPPGRYCILIECDGEGQQRELLERLTQENLKCRALIA